MIAKMHCDLKKNIKQSIVWFYKKKKTDNIYPSQDFKTNKKTLMEFINTF